MSFFGGRILITHYSPAYRSPAAKALSADRQALATGRRQGLLSLGIKESLYVKGVSVQQQSKNLAAKKNFA
jgi:hypothetical protein